MIVYILIRGALPAIFQSLTPEMYLPIQALTVGVTWPSVLLSVTLPKDVEKITY